MGSLGKKVTYEEIKHALFYMSPWKASGHDGFSVGFYQRAWHTVGIQFYEYIKKVCKSPSEVSTINQTNICMIPKKKHLDCINHFRPISLCNVLYKVVSKMLVERLKVSIPNRVSPFQSGFVLGIRIHESIIIA